MLTLLYGLPSAQVVETDIHGNLIYGIGKKITILACIWYCAVVGIGDGISTSVEKPDV
jgi:hypothetical protein